MTHIGASRLSGPEAAAFTGQTLSKGGNGPRYNHLVDEFSREFPGAEGQGVTVAVFDAGAVRGTHKEFKQGDAPNASRVTILTRIKVSTHSTHVAGIMAAGGNVQPMVKGMAPALSVTSEDWEDDLDKLARLAPRVQISNHS